MRPATTPSTDFPAGYERVGRPLALAPILLLLGILAAAGLFGGWSMITDRTGGSLEADLAWLEGTPVDDFLLPGLFLFLVYGVLAAIVTVGLWTRWSAGALARLDHRLGHHWSWWGAIAIGLVLNAWIVYQLFVIPDTIWIQPALAGLGLAVVGLSMLPSVRSYARTR